MARDDSSSRTLKHQSNLDAVFVSVGGGGLISGIALYIKLMNPSIKVIGCQHVNDCCMYKCVKADRILDDYTSKQTFSDGTAGDIEPGSVTFDICKQYVDEWEFVEERAVYDVLDK